MLGYDATRSKGFYDRARNNYEVDGVMRPLTTRQETIKVAGGKPVTITVRSTDNGPIFFRQRRTGREGKIFSVWKFRTMVTDADLQKARAEVQEMAARMAEQSAKMQAEFRDIRIKK